MAGSAAGTPRIAMAVERSLPCGQGECAPAINALCTCRWPVMPGIRARQESPVHAVLIPRSGCGDRQRLWMLWTRMTPFLSYRIRF